MKHLRRLISVLLSLSIIAFNFTFFSFKADAFYAGRASTYVDGYHHFPNVAYGGSRFAVLNAAEVTSAYRFDSENQNVTRTMDENNAPCATFYSDISKTGTVRIPLSFTILDKTYCDSMNYTMVSYNSAYSFDCSGQQFVNDKPTGYECVHYLTGPAPVKDGQIIEFIIGMWTDIAQDSTFSSSTFIHAQTLIKIRLVGFGGNTVDDKVSISNLCLRNYPNVYTTDRTLSVYNVDGGTNGSYSNSQDGGVSMGNEYFPIYSRAYAYVYIDSSRYSDMSQTDIYFSHDVRTLCGCGGWSWANVIISSDYASYSLSRSLDYTVEDASLVRNVYNLPFKIQGKAPGAGETAVITVTSRCNALGHNSPEQIFYNSDAPIVLTVYGIDKTMLKAAIDAQMDSNHPQENYERYLSALEKANNVYNDPRASQDEIDSACQALNEAIEKIDYIEPELLVLKESSSLVMNDGLLSGDFSSVSDIKNEFDNENIFIYSPEGNLIDSIKRYSTGIRIAVKTEGEIRDSVYTVIKGDANCDGNIDAEDAMIASVLKFGIPQSFAAYILPAADINENNDYDEYDINYLIEKGLLLDPELIIEEKPVDDTPDFIGENDIIVSPDGDDSADGKYHTPLASLEAAKEKAKSVPGSESITVWLREGVYRLTSTLNFNSSDRQNVTYRAFPDEKVSLSGSREISGFTQTQVNGVTAFAADIDFDTDIDGFNTLYNGNIRLTRPTWPENGEFSVASVDIADALNYGHTYFDLNTSFNAHPDNLLNFHSVKDVDVRIMHYWKDDLLPLYSVNTSSGRVEVQKPSSMSIASGDRYVFENVFEALNAPGEWYFDRAQSKLFYIPFSGETAETMVLNMGVNNILIRMDRCSGIKFENITLRDTDWRMQSGESPTPLNDRIVYYSDMTQACYDVPCTVEVEYSHGIEFKDCDFRMIGSSGLRFGYGTYGCSVTSTRFNNIGGNAVYIKGLNDANSAGKVHNITVKDCLIETYGRVFNNAIGVLLIHAYNCIIDHNEIHDGFYTGVSVGWRWGYDYNITNNIQITYNHIYDIGQGWLSDMGGIYTLGMQPETVIKGNHIHNVGCYSGSSGYGGWGIYLDEGSSGIDVYQNLVYNCSSDGFHQHYGKYNDIHNNIFALNGEAQMKLSRVESHVSFNFFNNILLANNTNMYANITSVAFNDNNNLYWDMSRGGDVYSDGEDISYVTDRGYYNNAKFADPNFSDPASFDFTFSSTDAADSIGFVIWDYSEAGTFTHFAKRYEGKSNGESVTVHSLQHYPDVALGNYDFTVFGAYEVSSNEYEFVSEQRIQTREMSDSDAPTAVFYIDTTKCDSVKIQLEYETTNKEYCDILNYYIASSDPLYRTNAPSQIFVSSFPVGTKRNHFVSGPAPAEPGDVKEFTLTMWTDIAQENTFSQTNYIHSGTKIKIMLIGV